MVSKLNQREKAILNSFFQELFEVLKFLDQGVEVLNKPIPIDFHELNSDKISKSLFKFLDKLEAEKIKKESEEGYVKPTKKHKLKQEKKIEADEADDQAAGEQAEEEQEEEDLTKTTILRRIEANEYKSLYQIYHDIKVASTIAIISLRKGCKEYQNVDNFYKVSVELLLREINRLGFKIQELEDSQENDLRKTHNLEETLAKNFYKISTSITVPTGETLSVLVGKNLPLFSSLNAKSELDDREPVVEEPFSIVKVAPQLNSLETPTLSSISISNFKFAHPSVAPTELLQQYFHPNWYNLPVGQWLTFGQHLDAEFAPKIDESRAVLSNEWRGLSWLEQFGFNKLNDLQDEYSELVAKLNEDNDEKEEDGGDKDVEMEEAAPVTEETEAVTETAQSTEEAKTGEAKLSETPAPKTIATEESTETQATATKNGDGSSNEIVEKESEVVDEGKKEEEQQHLIDLENILSWNPDHVVDEDELQAVRSKKSQQYINKLLMDLQKMRQKRFREAPVVNAQAPMKVAKPGRDEIKAFYKARRLLTHLISAKNINPQELNYKVSTKLPVLQTTYGGSLAAPLVTNATGANKSNDSKNSNTNRYKKKR